eukprot:5220573-Prymnesium_polylepis.1
MTTNSSLSLTNVNESSPPPIAQPLPIFIESADRNTRAWCTASLRAQHTKIVLSTFDTTR